MLYPKRLLASILWRVFTATGWGARILLRPYPYMMRPAQLFFLCRSMEELRHVPGIILEAGCAYGATTVFLNHFLEEKGIKKPYVAMDTFAGFVPEHAAFEIERRIYAGLPESRGSEPECSEELPMVYPRTTQSRLSLRCKSSAGLRSGDFARRRRHSRKFLV